MTKFRVERSDYSTIEIEADRFITQNGDLVFEVDTGKRTSGTALNPEGYTLYETIALFPLNSYRMVQKVTNGT